MITVADARAHLGLDSTHDPVLARLISEATATLGRELGRYLGPPELKTEVHCGGAYPGHPEIFLHYDALTGDDYPVVVTTRNSAFEAFTTLATDQWIVEGRLLQSRSTFPAGRGTVRVVYWSGYPTGEGPGELMDLVRQMVQLKHGTRGIDGLLKSETLGDYSYTRGDLEALDSWNTTVNHWRRRLV